MKKMDKKAFTLIELLVVIAVIGILVLLGAPRFTGYTQKAERIRIQHDVKVMEEEIGTVLINGDDEFNEWENNSKDYLNQLAQDNELFEKEGPVVANDEEPIDGSYKIIPEKYKDKINTKLKGTFYANSDGKVYYEHGKGPGYSDEEIDDLINNCDFIPIATPEDLDSIRNATTRTYGKGTKWVRECEGGLDKKYIQVKNVDLSGYPEEGWKPIGTDSSRFTGTYDGGDYVIRGLEVKGEDKEFQGLFGYTYEATISNVGLIDNIVIGGSNVGGLVGQAENTDISNSYATGSVESTERFSRVGGLVGRTFRNTDISNSYATGSVIGKEEVGGLVGMAGTGGISNSYATGPVKGSVDVGGLTGVAGDSTIENSYATGKVTSTGTGIYTASRAGGLVGNAVFDTTISNSYATGDVTAESYSVGGLVGSVNKGPQISNSYATGSVESSDDLVGGLVGYFASDSGSSTINNSYATGSVKGAKGIGGLVGRATFSTSKISNSYATGAVTGTEEVGGLVGDGHTVTIENSYATGLVEGTVRRIGGLVGYHGNTINSYWDKETTKQTRSAGQDESFGKTTEEMKNQTTYSGWNFDTVWKIDDGKYPTLR